MKKIKENWKFLVVIVSIFIIFIGIILLLPNTQQKEKEKFPEEKKQIDENNFYKYADDVVKLEDMEVIQNDGLKKAHCLDDICISNVEITYLETFGRVDYQIVNMSEKEKNGYMRMVFSNGAVLIPYQKLKAHEVRDLSAQFSGYDLRNENDYTLEILTPEESSRIVKK